MGREQFRTFDIAEHLDTPSMRAAYLKAVWEDSAGDPVAVAASLGDVARALGMSQIARDTGVAREALYKALSAKGNPELGTVVKVLRAMGLELSVQPIVQSVPSAEKRLLRLLGGGPGDDLPLAASRPRGTSSFDPDLLPGFMRPKPGASSAASKSRTARSVTKKAVRTSKK